MKKALALILTLIMVLGLMPAAMATEPTTTPSQIGSYYDKDGNLTNSSPLSYGDNKVFVSKTIAQTGKENVFDITLTVKTTEEIKEVTSETADAAVVLVIDISNSMSSDMMANAQKAAQEFINSFAEGDTSTRKIAIVAFGTRAHQISGWVEASTLKTAPGEVNSTISGIKPNINSDTGGTNMHDGLLKASELLENSAISSISNKNVLLFTDGVPTYYINDNGELDGSGNTNGLSQIDHNNHVKVEETVRNNFSGIGKYAVYLGNKRIYCKQIYPKCSLYGPELIFYGGETVENWLKSLKSSDGTGFAAYSTSNASELAKIFKSISELIKLKAQAWQLTDPMGDNIEFVQFLDTNISEKKAIQSGGTISWDLKNDSTKVPDDEIYTYTLSYRIKLNTLSSGFAKDTFYKTNGVTDLTYFIEKQGTAGGLKHAYFNVPSVKGFAGDLTFTKVDENNEPLKGAEFRLTTTDDPKWSMVGTPSDGGTSFTFSGIPSGHTYNLEETKTPEGYQGLDGEYTVEVNYGNVVLNKNGAKVNDTDGKLYVINTPAVPDTGSLTIKKVFEFAEGEATNTRPDSIEFTVQQNVQEGETGYSYKVTLTPNDNWETTIDNVHVGEYTVTEGNADITNYKWTNEEEKTKVVTVSADKTAPATVMFKNKYEKLSPDIAEQVFNVTKKVVQGGNVAPGKNTFNFEFRILEDTPIDAARAALPNVPGYTVTVDGIEKTPDESGLYRFTIAVNGAAEKTAVVRVTGNKDMVEKITALKIWETGTAPAYWVYDNDENGKEIDIGASATFTNTYTYNPPTPTPTPKPGGGHHHYDPLPVPPVVVIPPKTGDMTIWQSILHFLGIR